MKKQLVVITYIAGESQGQEIALALEGWKQHFKEPCHIVVVGDVPPVPNIEVLPVARMSEKDGEYRPHLDICKKLRDVCLAYGGEYDSFIWASDDCYAVNDFTLADVMTPKFYANEMPPKGENHFNPWWRNLVKTRKLCEKEGYGVVNWVTHLPLYFRIEELLQTINDYNLTENSYVVENIVYNRFKPQGTPEKLNEQDRWKFPVYFTPLDREGFKNALASKIWVTNSVNGWSDALAQELWLHYNKNKG